MDVEGERSPLWVVVLLVASCDLEQTILPAVPSGADGGTDSGGPPDSGGAPEDASADSTVSRDSGPPGECEPGEISEVPCGNCGRAARTCTDARVWGPAGACAGEGECAPGRTEKITCGRCGARTRECGDACAWGNWGPCRKETGDCDPGDWRQCEVGSCSGGQECDDDCSWSECDACECSDATAGTACVGEVSGCIENTRWLCRWDGTVDRCSFWPSYRE